MSPLSLATLPPVILDFILGNHAHSYLVLRLWKCGNRLLHATLANGLTYVRLRTAEFASQTGFPHLLLDLRSLRHLSVFSFERLMGKNAGDWSLINSKLPPNLETLEITSQDADEALWRPQLTYNEPGSRIIDLQAYYPHLKTLKLVFASPPPVLFASFFNEDDLALLPTSLTHLETHLLLNGPDSGDSRFLKRIPRSLIRLESLEITGELAHVPYDELPGLQTLALTIAENSTSFKWLPRTITKRELKPPPWNHATSQTYPPLFPKLRKRRSQKQEQTGSRNFLAI